MEAKAYKSDTKAREKKAISKLRAKVDPAHAKYMGEAWMSSPATTSATLLPDKLRDALQRRVLAPTFPRILPGGPRAASRRLAATLGI